MFGLVELAPLWYVPMLLYLGLASGTAQAVINTYGTGLDTSSIIPKLTRVQATLVACAVATLLVYLGYFFSGIIDAVSTALSLLAVLLSLVDRGHDHRLLPPEGLLHPG